VKLLKLSLLSNGSVVPVEVEESAGRVRIRIDGQPTPIEVSSASEPGDSLLSLVIGGQSYEAQVRLEERQIWVELDGERFVFELVEPGSRPRASRSPAGGPAEVRAPMPGKVVKLLVAAGDAVEAGQGLLLFEAMKMQNEIRSPLAGKVLQVKAREGQVVEARDLLLILQN